MRGADLVVKYLKQEGVDTVFGYPGGAIMPVYDALYDGGLKHVLCRHEQGAAFAAVGYARASGQVGVCIATSGPGATNLITGLADAYLDSVPVVAITGQVASPVIGTDAFQEIDVLGLSLACTKHSFMVTSKDDLASIMQQAFSIAKSGRPGPVLVDIPKDIQLADIEAVLNTSQAEAINTCPSDKIDDAIALMQQAKQPILYVGGGVGMAGAVDQLQDFVDATGMPSVTTLKGIGAIPNNKPYALGMLGMHGTKAANLCVQKCDLLVVIGARFDDRVTGRLESFAAGAKVLHIDIDPAEINKLRATDISICGDLTQLLPKLATNLDIKEWQQYCWDLKQEYRWNYDAPYRSIYAPKLLNQLSEKLPDNAVVSCDVGQHQMWVAQHMNFTRPENHLSSAGLGTMGFGLPAGIGARHARKDDPVVVVSGDGSFMMNVQELGTIKREKLNVKIVLIDNQRLGMVRQWQQLFFEERYSETILTDNPDFVALAKAFDIEARTITQQTEVLPALNEMLASEGAYLLHVRINEADNVWPLVPPGASNADMMEKV
ncbi:acetolactate synthase 2 catalytic subunit [Psychrobium sp. 1_MG-2023]|uniref:acetolactate synthase 2 catalytic subunit n=1 Tax=Psychrobium sp. 1_MG-2023 TaxID=3062624 RepID=UPI000C3237F9|nr:acetolactate synthase 2 catalytic subunit [Psychrobium sp. 1_MG-2023]MDP2562622.1 acetolactate synthase 2 catalytic subunit [Psychrobium sp. 1_MG-2023]PKF54396.1 acetolactate synthase 2 catalytic subunit [Alteromonadales bacterium alter-6D02]